MSLRESFHCLSPQLPVTDLDRSILHYVDQFGFVLNFRAEDGSYAGVGIEGSSNVSIHLLQVANGAQVSPVVVVLGTIDIEALYQTAQAAELSPHWTEADAGREFRVRDPDGHELSVFDVT